MRIIVGTVIIILFGLLGWFADEQYHLISPPFFYFIGFLAGFIPMAVYKYRS